MSKNVGATNHGSELDGMTSIDWRCLKLDQLGTLQRGRSRHRPRYAFHLYGGNYPFIQTGEIREARKYVRVFEQTYNEAGLEQSKLWPKASTASSAMFAAMVMQSVPFGHNLLCSNPASL